MIHHTGGAGEIGGCRHHLPAEPPGGGEEAVHLRAVADLVQQGLAAMDQEIVKAGAVVGEAVRLVENAGEQDSGHLEPLRADLMSKLLLAAPAASPGPSKTAGCL